MAKDNPQDRFNQIAKQLRALVVDIPGEAITPHGKLLFLIAGVFDDAVDPPPDPEPKIPPGELVVDQNGNLRAMSGDGPIAMCPTVSRYRCGETLRLATGEDACEYIKASPKLALAHFRHLARLVVSQEPKPELKGDDKLQWEVVERRLSKSGEPIVNQVTGYVYHATFDSELLVWIVKPKENSNERQGTDA